MLVILLFLFALVACSADNNLAEASGDADTASGGPDTGPPTDSDTGGTDADTAVPDGWVLRADLAVAAGAPTIDGARVAVDVVDSVRGVVACTVELDTAGLAVGEPPDPAVYAWWTLTVLPVGDACVDGLPGTLGIGIGELVGDARAGLGAHGYDAVADSLYGAYVAEEADEVVYVFGYAGTDADLAGDDAASSPLADGLYHLAPLYVLALPE